MGQAMDRLDPPIRARSNADFRAGVLTPIRELWE